MSKKTQDRKTLVKPITAARDDRITVASFGTYIEKYLGLPVGSPDWGSEDSIQLSSMMSSPGQGYRVGSAAFEKDLQKILQSGYFMAKYQSHFSIFLNLNFVFLVFWLLSFESEWYDCECVIVLIVIFCEVFYFHIDSFRAVIGLVIIILIVIVIITFSIVIMIVIIVTPTLPFTLITSTFKKNIPSCNHRIPADETILRCVDVWLHFERGEQRTQNGWNCTLLRRVYVVVFFLYGLCRPNLNFQNETSMGNCKMTLEIPIQILNELIQLVSVSCFPNPNSPTPTPTTPFVNYHYDRHTTALSWVVTPRRTNSWKDSAFCGSKAFGYKVSPHTMRMSTDHRRARWSKMRSATS